MEKTESFTVITGDKLSKPLTKKRKEQLYWQEVSYRRGYYDGYSTALDDIKMIGIKIPKSIYNFFNKTLFKWKNNSSVALKIPPQIQKYKKINIPF